MSEHKLDDDQVLQYTQGLRKQLVTAIVEKGMPEDNKDRMVLLGALADMDRTALGNKRINKDEEIARDDRAAASILARVYETLGGKNPFEQGVTIEGQARQVKLPEKLLEVVEFVDGETDIGISSESYEDFARRTDM
jgi:hypothetical protein